MNRYHVEIYLTDGRKFDVRLVEKGPTYAKIRVQYSEEFKDFMGSSSIDRVDVQEIAIDDIEVKINPERYQFEDSREVPGWCTVTDTFDKLILYFEKGRVNDTAKIHAMNDPNMTSYRFRDYHRMFAGYLREYHPEVFGKNDQGDF